MSVVQHIRERAGHFRWMGLLVVWAVFIAMAAVLLIERAGVQYSAGQHKLGMLAANDAVPASSAMFGRKPTCLVITDSDQDGVEDVKEQFDQILLDMKIAHRDVDIATDGADVIPSLTSFDRVILLMPSIDGLGTHLSDIMSWVSAGGSLMLAMTPDNSSCLQAIGPKLGIDSAGYEYTAAESIVPSEDFMIGGGQRYELSDPFDSSLSVSLRETAHVWAKTGDTGTPLIWSSDCGTGRTVVCNIGIYDKVMRGFYAAAVSLLGDATAYPVINSAVFYLDDFPSPVPSGDGTYVKRDYGLSIADFYAKVWWPDLQKLAQQYGIRYTGVMIENYEDVVNQTEPTRQADTTQFRYFGGMLLQMGGSWASTATTISRWHSGTPTMARCTTTRHGRTKRRLLHRSTSLSPSKTTYCPMRTARSTCRRRISFRPAPARLSVPTCRALRPLPVRTLRTEPTCRTCRNLAWRAMALWSSRVSSRAAWSMTPICVWPRCPSSTCTT